MRASSDMQREPSLHARGARSARAARAQLLVSSFNVAAAEGVMCRDTVSVGWDGRLFDCDFNQQLALGLRCGPDPTLSCSTSVAGAGTSPRMALGLRCGSGVCDKSQFMLVGACIQQ